MTGLTSLVSLVRAVLVGAGGHARVVLEAARLSGFKVACAVDERRELHGCQLDGVPIVGGDEAIRDLVNDGIAAAIIGVGSVDVTDARASLFARLVGMGLDVLAVRHPSASVAANARLGDGAVVLAGAVLNAGTMIGANVIVNTRAIVGVGCRIGDHVHIAPGARIGDGVLIDERSHIAIGSRILAGVRVGRQCMVAAGAVVADDLPDRSRVAGVPARPMSRR